MPESAQSSNNDIFVGMYFIIIAVPWLTDVNKHIDTRNPDWDQ